jgi:hypothetical protein
VIIFFCGTFAALLLNMFRRVATFKSTHWQENWRLVEYLQCRMLMASWIDLTWVNLNRCFVN